MSDTEEELDQLVDEAWSLLSAVSANSGGWQDQSPEWRAAAQKWELDYARGKGADIGSAAGLGVPIVIAADSVETEGIEVEARRIIGGDRRETYGPVQESFERVAKLWSAIIGTEVTVQQFAAMMVCLKVSRELGGKSHRDNFVDIVGYTLLWEMVQD